MELWWQSWGHQRVPLESDGRLHEVQFRKNGGAMKSRAEILHMWNGVLIRHSNVIQVTIIATRSPVTLRPLRNHMQGGGPVA